MKIRELTRLEKLRLEKGLTRPELASLCGVSIFYIQKLEIGELSFREMKLSTLLKLSKGLKVKPKEILPLELARELKYHIVKS